MFLLLLVSYCEVTVSGVADASVSVVWNFSFQIKKTYHKSICKILLFNASLTIIYKFTRLLLNILFQDQDTLYGTRALQMAGTIIQRFCYFLFILLYTVENLGVWYWLEEVVVPFPASSYWARAGHIPGALLHHTYCLQVK